MPHHLSLPHRYDHYDLLLCTGAVSNKPCCFTNLGKQVHMHMHMHMHIRIHIHTYTYTYT